MTSVIRALGAIGKFWKGFLIGDAPELFVGTLVFVGAALALVLALTAGIVGTTWQAAEARRQRAEALTQRARTSALLGRNEAIVGFIRSHTSG